MNFDTKTTNLSVNVYIIRDDYILHMSFSVSLYTWKRSWLQFICSMFRAPKSIDIITSFVTAAEMSCNYPINMNSKWQSFQVQVQFHQNLW